MLPQYYEYKSVSLKNKCLRHSINSKDNGIGTMKLTKFCCHVLMTKFISKTMDMMNQLLVIRVIYKK